MGTVMIRCPRTGEAVSTEINTEAAVFERLPDVASRIICPSCGDVHVWTTRNAWLTDALLPPLQPAEPVPQAEEER